jgi:hypothetical protein
LAIGSNICFKRMIETSLVKFRPQTKRSAAASTQGRRRI